MAGIITLLLVITISIIVTRIATIALIHTGLSRETARFQARSALTGVGFTTSESEKVVNRPIRRRILMLLMLLGNAGIVTGISSLIIGFVGDQGGSRWLRILVLFSGIGVIWALAVSPVVERALANLITRLLARSTPLQLYDFATLLHLSGEYRIGEVGVDTAHWLCGRTVRDSQLREEGILILGITRRDGTFLGTPLPETPFLRGDNLVVYGRATALAELESREKGREGYQEHRKQMRMHRKEVKEVEKLDRESQGGAGSGVEE